MRNLNVLLCGSVWLLFLISVISITPSFADSRMRYDRGYDRGYGGGYGGGWGGGYGGGWGGGYGGGYRPYRPPYGGYGFYGPPRPYGRGMTIVVG